MEKFIKIMLMIFLQAAVTTIFSFMGIMYGCWDEAKMACSALERNFLAISVVLSFFVAAPYLVHIYRLKISSSKELFYYGIVVFGFLLIFTYLLLAHVVKTYS